MLSRGVVTAVFVVLVLVALVLLIMNFLGLFALIITAIGLFVFIAVVLFAVIMAVAMIVAIPYYIMTKKDEVHYGNYSMDDVKAVENESLDDRPGYRR